MGSALFAGGQSSGRGRLHLRAGIALLGVLSFLLSGVSGSAHRAASQDPAPVQAQDVSALPADPDTDSDGMPDPWETFFGLLPNDPTDAAGDPDGDGLTNLQEYQTQGHPVGRFARYFAEGSTGAFFDTSLGLVNLSTTDVAHVSLAFVGGSGVVATHQVTLQPRARQTVSADAVLGPGGGAVGTIVESDVPFGADRLVKWGATGYGSTIDSGEPAPATTWYLAEGATGLFEMYLLLMNPGLTPANVTVKYLREVGTPITKSYTVPARSRETVFVNTQDIGLLVSSHGAVITSDVPIVAERSMYFSILTLFGAGTGGSGMPQLSTQWHFAEGATGPFFDEFLALLNPSTQPVTATVTYRLATGVTLTKNYTIQPERRRTIYLNLEALVDPALAQLGNAAVWVTVDSTLPIAAERVMWWEHLFLWNEGTASHGTITPGTSFVIPEGTTGGAQEDQTYALIANTSGNAGQVRLTLLEDSGTTTVHTLPIGALQRLSVDVAAEFSLAASRFSLLVESVGASPVPLVVDYSRYSSPGGVPFAAGGSTPAIPTAPADAAPTVTSTTPANNAAGVAITSNITVNFSEPVNVTASAFTLQCPSGTPVALTNVTGTTGSSFTLDPDVNLPANGPCVFTVVAAQVTDVDTNDPPDAMAADHVVTFTTESDAAPTVTATTPANGATDVGINTNLSVTFSESVNATASAFVLECPAASPIPLTSLTGSPATIFDLDPNTPMPANTTCVLTVVASQVTDADVVDPPDTMAANFVATFQTEAEAAPAVSSTIPANGATQVATNATLTITFTEGVNVAGEWFQIACPTSGTRNVGATAVAGGPVVYTIDPTVDFAQGEVCTVTVFAAQVTDTDAVDPPNAMAADHVFSFTTDVAPAVSATVPTNGATQVATNTTIGVTFTEPVTLTGSWMQIACPTSGTRGVGDVVVSGGPAAFTIDPNVDFAEGETCTVTVFAAQVSDQDPGDPPDTLAADFVFSFTTDTAPTVSSTLPVNGATDVTTTATLSVTFSEPVNVTGEWFQIACPTSGNRAVGDTVVGGGPTAFTIDPNADFAAGEACTVTIVAPQVTDQDSGDPPDAMAANHVFSFTIDQAPSVTGVTPANAATVATNSDVTITFSEPVNVTGTWFTIVCGTSGPHNPGNTAVGGGPTIFTLNPTADFAPGESCALTVNAAQVADQDAADPPDAMVANFVSGFQTDAAPQVTNNTPAAGATQVPANTDITLTFSEDVNVTGNWFTIACASSGTRNVGDTSVSGGPSAFTINPNADFTQGELCTVTVVATQVADVDALDPPDNLPANHVFSFTIDAAPSVTGTSPTNGETNVLPASNIVITFSESVNASTSSFTINCGSGNVAYGLSPASPSNAFTLDPTADLTGASCTVTVIAAQVTDADSADPPDTMLANHVFSFTLEQAPQVTTTVPANGATGILTNQVITVNFSEPVNASTGSFTIDCPPVAPLTFAVGGSGTTAVTLTPAGGLPAGAICTVTVLAAGITDVDTADPPDNLPANVQFAFSVPPIALGDSYAAIGHVTVDSGAAGVPFTVVSNDLFALPLTAVTVVSPTANGGTVTMTGAGAGQGQFIYHPPVGHGDADDTDTFTYSITNAAGTSLPGTVTFSVAQPIWFINNTPGACAAGCNGHQQTPFTSLADFQAVNNGAGSNPAPNDHIFVFESGTAHTGGVTLLSGQRLIGQDASSTLLAITGHGALPPGSTVPTLNSANGTFATIGAVRVNSNTVVRGLNITTSGATALDDPAAAITGVTVTEARISATNAPAVTLSSFTGTVTLHSVSASGSTHGISLSGTSGPFAVLGADGGDAGSDPDAGTGGTISNTSGRGAAFVNHTGTISLGGMNFTSTNAVDPVASSNCGAPATVDNAACGAAIHFTNGGASGSVTLNTVLVNGSSQVGINASGINNLTMTNVEVMNAGTDSLESGVVLRNITGTSTVTGSNFHDNEARQFHVANAAGTGTLTIQSSTIENAPAPNGGIGLLMEAYNAGTNLTVHTGGLVAGQGVTINNLFSNGWQALSANNATLTATLRGSSITNTNGIVAQASLNSQWNGAIEGNTFVAGPNTGAGVVSIKTDGGGSMDIDAIGNTIGQNGVADSGTACDSCGGFFINPRNGGNMTVDVIGNVIQNVDGNGIFIAAGETASHNVNATITGNLIRQPGPFATLQRIAVELRNGVTSGPPADAGCMAVTLGGAVTPGSWPSTAANAKNQILGTWNQQPTTNDDVFLWQRFSTIIRLPGLAGSVATFITNNNVFDGTPVVTVLETVPGNIQAGTCP